MRALPLITEEDGKYVSTMLPGSCGEVLGSMGVSSLRAFLEGLLKQRYLDNLATIVPQLSAACDKAGAALRRADAQLECFSIPRLRQLASAAANRFAAALDSLRLKLNLLLQLATSC